jgi:hypothetical protein
MHRLGAWVVVCVRVVCVALCVWTDAIACIPVKAQKKKSCFSNCRALGLGLLIVVSIETTRTFTHKQYCRWDHNPRNWFHICASNSWKDGLTVSSSLIYVWWIHNLMYGKLYSMKKRTRYRMRMLGHLNAIFPTLCLNTQLTEPDG